MRNGKRKGRISAGEPAAISWERVRRIFGNPRPPKQISERQFDYNDEALHRLANTAYDEVDFSDLWYYHHDLAYVELQPDLFNYLFPVCLMDWHQSLMDNRPCSYGDSEFHNGVLKGNVFEKMLTYAGLILFGTNRALTRHLAASEIVFEYRSSDASGSAQDRRE